MKQVPFHILKGQTITKISAPAKDETIDEVEIEVGAKKYILYHYQDCCEEVKLIKIIGDTQSLVGKTITLAEEDSLDPPWWKGEYSKYTTHTWSAFYLEAGTSRLELWFLGESNGYYNESVSFYEK
jgi:hypothetical protein